MMDLVTNVGQSRQLKSIEIWNIYFPEQNMFKEEVCLRIYIINSNSSLFTLAVTFSPVWHRLVASPLMTNN